VSSSLAIDRDASGGHAVTCGEAMVVTPPRPASITINNNLAPPGHCVLEVHRDLISAEGQSAAPYGPLHNNRKTRHRTRSAPRACSARLIHRQPRSHLGSSPGCSCRCRRSECRRRRRTHRPDRRKHPRICHRCTWRCRTRSSLHRTNPYSGRLKQCAAQESAQGWGERRRW
jgi:hypothetical protein